LENYDFLEYIIKSTNRFLNKHGRAYEAENILIKSIKKLAKVMTNQDRTYIFRTMQLELTEILKDRNEQAVLEYFDLDSWLASKLSKQTFSEEVRKKLKSN